MAHTAEASKIIHRLPDATPRWVLPAAIPGLLLPVLGYVLLPMLGIETFVQMFEFKRLVLLCGAVIGGVLYLYYLRFVLSRPQILLAFIVLAWPLAECISTELLRAGLNIHMRPLLILSVAVPSLWINLRHLPLLNKRLPWLKYYIGFFLWLLLYFVFFNANAVDPRMNGGEEAVAENSVGMIQTTAYFYCLMAMMISAVSALRVRDYKGLFDTINKALLIVSGLESLVTTLGYPLGMFTQLVDGFIRATGIFSHPNPFAHHMGILMVYLLGLFCYYQDDRKARMPLWLLWSGIGLNFVAFLLGFSKTGLGVFALCAGILFTMNLAVPAVRRSFIQIIVAVAILIPLGLLGFEAISGQSFMSMLQSRMDDTTSLSWRTQVWQDLMAEVDLGSAWLGHGFTSANATVFRLTFNDAKNAQPLMMVHNAYIALIYDLGVMGYLLFGSTLALMVTAAKGWLAAIRPALRTEYSIIIAMAVYFLVVCGFDEMSYMFDAPMLFWTLTTLLFCVGWRESVEAKALQALEKPLWGNDASPARRKFWGETV
jgi:hypothetical protein